MQFRLYHSRDNGTVITAVVSRNVEYLKGMLTHLIARYGGEGEVAGIG